MSSEHPSSTTLPAINSTKVLKTYTQRLENNQQIGKPYMVVFGSETEGSEGKQSRILPHQMNSIMNELSNIQKLLKDGENLDKNNTGVLEGGLEEHLLSGRFNTQSVSTSFYKTGKNHVADELRTSTSSAQIKQSRNNSKNQKDMMRTWGQFKKSVEHIPDFSTPRLSVPNKLFELSGKKVQIQEQSSVITTSQQKEYLKKIRQDPLTTYQAKSATNQKPVIHAPSKVDSKHVMMNSSVNFRHTMYKSTGKISRNFMRGTNPFKVNTVVMNGDNLQPSMNVKTPHIHSSRIEY